MEHRKQHLPLIAARVTAAAALLALGSGCVTPDLAKKPAAESPAKPDVMKPGVLPPPQEIMKASQPAGAAPVAQTGAPGSVAPAGQPVVPAAARVPAPIAADVPVTAPGSAAAAAAAVPSPLKLAGLSPAKPVAANNMAVAWRNRIAYLPDPSRNGAMGAGLAGQLFLFGGPKLEFAQADGTLTVDLVDDTPRPAGQPGAKAERWQFDKHTLRKLQTMDETFGKSYVLFLPWPEYKPDITRVRISARYDPTTGDTLFQAPTTLTIDTSAPLGAQPVWDMGATNAPPAAPKVSMSPQPLSPQPIAPTAGPAPLSPSVTPLGPLPIGGPPPAAPNGATLDGLPPIAITIGR